MRVRKPLAAAAALGIAVTLGGFLPSADAGTLPPAGDPIATTFTCVGDDSVLQGEVPLALEGSLPGGPPATSQKVVELLGVLAETGATSITLEAAITPFVPESLLPDESSPVQFDVTSSLPPDTIESAIAIGITNIDVLNQSYTVIQNGGTPESITATPADTSIDITGGTGGISTTIEGDVTAGDETDILYQLGAVKLGVSIAAASLGGTIAFGLDCGVVPPATDVLGETFVTGVAPSTTTTTISIPPASPTTTAAPTTTAVSGTGTPRFTG
jgi:hypothetical protein